MGTLHKWDTMKEGPLAQRLPSHVPGRDFLSASRANSLKVPFTKKEALIKLGKQKDLVLQLLMLGAYSLPSLCLSSLKLDKHLRDMMHKDMKKCFVDLRKGINIT